LKEAFEDLGRAQGSVPPEIVSDNSVSSFLDSVARTCTVRAQNLAFEDEKLFHL